jgi:hypothetical protein
MLLSILFAPLLFLASFTAAREAQAPVRHHESPQSSTPSALRVAIIGKPLHFQRLQKGTFRDVWHTERIFQVLAQPDPPPPTISVTTQLSTQTPLRSPSISPYSRPDPALGAALPRSMPSTTHAILLSSAQAFSSK